MTMRCVINLQGQLLDSLHLESASISCQYIVVAVKTRSDRSSQTSGENSADTWRTALTYRNMLFFQNLHLDRH